MTTRKSQKGNRFTSDYIDYDVAMKKGTKLLINGKKPVIGLYIIVAVNLGLRVSDMLSLTHVDLFTLSTGEHIDVINKKTKKTSHIVINKKVKDAHDYYMKHYYKGNELELDGVAIFTSQKGTVYATESLNTILKQVFKGDAKHVSTHSLRKSFGRHVYENNGESEKALVWLSQIFMHTSMATTKIYLGINQEELDGVFMNL